MSVNCRFNFDHCLTGDHFANCKDLFWNMGQNIIKNRVVK